jgi:hypothetical protein
MLKELGSISSVRFNNFLFCTLFIMAAGMGSGHPKAAFWSTLFFQLILIAPLLVTFSIDTQHRLPAERLATWPLTGTQRLWLSSVSFALNPFVIVLFLGYLFWMGLVAGLFFVLLALIVHTTVYAVGRLPFKLRIHASLGVSWTPLKVGGIAQHRLSWVYWLESERQERDSGSWPLPSPSIWFPYSGAKCSGNDPWLLSLILE